LNDNYLFFILHFFVLSNANLSFHGKESYPDNARVSKIKDKKHTCFHIKNNFAQDRQNIKDMTSLRHIIIELRDKKKKMTLNYYFFNNSIKF